MTDTTTERVAVVTGGADNLAQVQAYLPDNYTAQEEQFQYQDPDGSYSSKTRIVIRGTDHAGWTLDDYVIPRLASGLVFAQEEFTHPPERPRYTVEDLIQDTADQYVRELLDDPVTQAMPALGHTARTQGPGLCDTCADLDGDHCLTLVEDVKDSASYVERISADRLEIWEDSPDGEALQFYMRGRGWLIFAEKVLSEVDRQLREKNGETIVVTTASWVQPLSSLKDEGPWPLHPQLGQPHKPGRMRFYQMVEQARWELADFYNQGGTDNGHHATAMTVTIDGDPRVVQSDSPKTPTSTYLILFEGTAQKGTVTRIQ